VRARKDDRRRFNVSSSEEAAGYIKTHCQHMGSYAGDLTPFKFLARVAEQMAAAPHTDLFPDRYKEHVAYALGIVARHGFLEPPAAVAAVYLATRFEFFFRLLSGKLKRDGTWLNKAVDQPAAVAALGEKGLKGKRVSEVAVTYKLMKLDQSRPAARVFAALDKAILPAPIMAVGCFEVADIGDRIAFGRHSAGHGLWGDISAEAVFYGLVTAIVFYNQT
jgi:hypothetical protein